MALETATYINGLVAANPSGLDPKSQGDDHIRLLKSTIKATLPNITGAVTATQAELNVLDGITASTAELNLLDGVTATTAEFNHIDGVTSPIQTQLDGKQPLDADLTAIAGLSSTGILARTGAGTASVRTLTAGAGITIANGDGVSGNPTIAVNATDLPNSAAVVSYTPSGTGAVATTVQAKLREFVSLEDFGAVGDGVADDTAEIQAAFTYAATSGLGRVIGTAGKTYNCGAVSADCGVVFDGNNCTIRATAGSWLNFSNGIAFSTSAVKNLKLVPTLAPSAGSYGIKFVSPLAGSQRGISIENIVIVGSDSLSIGSYGFEKYIQLDTAHYPTIKDINISGTFSNLAVGGGPAGKFVTTGISLEGQTIGAAIEHCRFGGLHTGVQAGTVQQEGVQIIACEMVGVRDAYDLRSSSFGGPGMWLINCHANSTRKGFDFGNRTDVSVVGCTAYRSNVLFDEPYIGFDFESVFGGRIATCTVVNSIVTGTNDSTAYRFLNSSGVTGSSNEVRSAMRGVVLQGGCSDISFDSTGFYGTSGYSTTVFETAASDADVYLGQHNIVSTWSNPYVIATFKDSIVIDLGRPNYNRIASVTNSAAGTYTLTPGASPQHWRISVAVGAGAYDVNVELSKTGARDGDYFDFYLNMPSAADRRVLFKDGVGGSTIATVATASSTRYGARFVYSRVAGAWQAAWINASAFI